MNGLINTETGGYITPTVVSVELWDPINTTYNSFLGPTLK